MLSHCAPDSIQDLLGGGKYRHDALTGFLEELRRATAFRCWLFGHYHENRVLREKYILLYQKIVRLV